jgi:hypothetical protein
VTDAEIEERFQRMIAIANEIRDAIKTDGSGRALYCFLARRPTDTTLAVAQEVFWCDVPFAHKALAAAHASLAETVNAAVARAARRN